MTRLRFATAVAAIFAIAAPQAAAAQRTADDSVRAIDADWARSYAIHDTALALRVFASDLVITSTNGSMKDARTELNDVRAVPGTKVDYFRSADVVVRLHGRTAIVTGRLEWKLTTNGQASPETTRRYTATYVPGGPLGWRMVALHIGRAS